MDWSNAFRERDPAAIKESISKDISENKEKKLRVAKEFADRMDKLSKKERYTEVERHIRLVIDATGDDEGYGLVEGLLSIAGQILVTQYPEAVEKILDEW